MARKTATATIEVASDTNNRSARLAQIVKETNARWVKKGITTADRPIVGTMKVMEALRGKRIPSGNINIDLKLKGGFRRGNSILQWGEDGVGKTAHAMMTAARVIEDGGTVLWIQTDPGNVLEMAKIQGIPEDCDRFYHQDVYGSGEMTFEILESFLTEDGRPSDLIDLVVIDSIAGLAPREELEAIKKDGLAESSQGMALPERMMSRLIRIMHSRKLYDKAVLILISEARVDMSSYGTPIKEKGGRATKHGVRLNLKFSKVGGKDGLITTGSGDKVKVIGHKYRIKFIKDGVSGRYQNYECENSVYYGIGLDNDLALYGLLIEEDALNKGGSWITPNETLKTYLPEGEWKFQGEARFKEELQNNEAFKNGCLEYLTALYDGLKVEEQLEEIADEEAESFVDEQLEEAEMLLLEEE